MDNRMRITKMVPFISFSDVEILEDMMDRIFMTIYPANI